MFGGWPAHPEVDERLSIRGRWPVPFRRWGGGLVVGALSDSGDNDGFPVKESIHLDIVTPRGHRADHPVVLPEVLVHRGSAKAVGRVPEQMGRMAWVGVVRRGTVHRSGPTAPSTIQVASPWLEAAGPQVGRRAPAHRVRGAVVHWSVGGRSTWVGTSRAGPVEPRPCPMLPCHRTCPSIDLGRA